MAEGSDPFIKGKSIEELLDLLGGAAEPGSIRHEQVKAALQARMVEQLIQPRVWAIVSVVAACVSAGAAVATALS